MSSARRASSLLAPGGLLLAALACWILWYPPSPDLAAQVYRVHLYSTEGFTLWDNAWYGGHYIPNYSLLFPPLAAALGLRGTGALAVSASVWAFRALLAPREHLRVALASTLFAIGASGDLFIGRVTFALGVALGLTAALAIARGRNSWCAVLSLACAAASPVAAAFLVLAASGDLLANRAPKRFALLAGPALALTAATLVLFPEQGYEPFALSSMLAALAASIAVLLLVPPEERLVRCTALLYAAALLLAYTVRSPMGSNAVRFGVLFAPAALAACVRGEDVHRVILSAAPWRRAPLRFASAARGSVRTASSALLAAIVGALVIWQLTGPVAQSVGASEDPASHLSFYTPVIDFLDRNVAGGPMRVEVPFTKSHWDATILGSRFALARGWDRQLDTRYNALFYQGHFSAAAYREWLLENAVRFVALSDAPMDFSSVQEAALVRGGLPFLRPAFESAHWHVYEVIDARPLASGAGYLTRLNGDGFSLLARHAGPSLVRVRYTPYWSVTSGRATVTRTADGWTELDARAPGRIVVDAEFLAGI